MHLKTHIVKYLKQRGNYEPEVDDPEIDMLIQNVEFAEIAIKDIRTNGLILSMPNGNGFVTTKENPAYTTYDKCLQNIHRSSNRLAIDRMDRLRLKIDELKELDKLNDALSKYEDS